MRRNLLLVVAVVCIALPAIAGPNKQVRYIGLHPIPKAEGSGLCYIEAPHVHIYDADRVQYRDHHGAYFFVGDPVAYGYEGDRHAYKGHHPIHVNVVVGTDEPGEVYCYLSGPHYHYFAPPDGPDFKLVGDTYFYVAEPPRAYVDARPAMMKINAVYQPLVYVRPVVTVEAPVGWIGARAEFVAPVAVVAPAAVVVAPRAGVRVEAHIPVPSVHIDVGVGVGLGVRPVIVRERGKVKHKHRGRHRGHRN
jgi:hypothetical protein